MTTPQGNALSAAHDVTQAHLLDLGYTELTLAFSTLLDPRDLTGSTPRYVPVAAELVRRTRARAAAVALNFYSALRAAEALDLPDVEPFVPSLPPPPATNLLQASMAVTGPIAAKSSLARGLLIDEAMDKALTATFGAMTRHVEGGPRDVARHNSTRDSFSNGWMRRSGGTPCPFCAMLISRGPVYKSSASADFKAHDRCHCKAIAFFGADEGWTAQSREYRAMWDDDSNGSLWGKSDDSFSKVYRRKYPKTISPAPVLKLVPPMKIPSLVESWKKSDLARLKLESA